MIESCHLPSPDTEGKRFIQLVSHSEQELPWPELLNIHAAIARILDASGKGNLDEQEDSQCLASDGSTGALNLWIAHAASTL